MLSCGLRLETKTRFALGRISCASAQADQRLFVRCLHWTSLRIFKTPVTLSDAQGDLCVTCSENRFPREGAHVRKIDRSS